MLKSLLRKMSGLREKVQTQAKFDKINVADEVRGQAASRMLSRIKSQFDKVIRSDIDMLESDINKQASLEVGALNFLAKAKNTFGNLLTLSIIKDAVVVAPVSEQQLIAFGTVPDAGLWSVSLYSQLTTNLAFNANAAAVQAALRAINGLADVTVSGDYTVGFTVVFAGASSGINHPLLVEGTNTLTTLAAPVVITISQTVAGVPGTDTRSVTVAGSDIKIHCLVAATNAEVKAQIEASAPASALISATIDAGQDAVAATAALNSEFTGGA